MRESELKFFKNLLSKRREQILQNIENSARELETLGEQNLSDDLDYASASAESLVGSSISLKQQKELREIDVALEKIRLKNFGICEMCEETIGIQRLKVKPHAKYCIVCREIVEKIDNKGRQ